jgi:hypothetical protein
MLLKQHVAGQAGLGTLVCGKRFMDSLPSVSNLLSTLSHESPLSGQASQRLHYSGAGFT